MCCKKCNDCKILDLARLVNFYNPRQFKVLMRKLVAAEGLNVEPERRVETPMIECTQTLLLITHR